MLRTIFLSVSLILASVLMEAHGAQDTYENRDVGITLTKPQEWHFIPADLVAQNLALPRLKAKELEKAIRSKPDVPFLVLAKHPEPHPGLNPSVQASFKTQGDLIGKGAKALLERMAERLRENFSDFLVLERITETTLSGQPAARMQARYTVKDSDNVEYKTHARMWVIPRGDYVLTINLYGATEGADTAEKEFEAILQSIKLAKE